MNFKRVLIIAAALLFLSTAIGMGAQNLVARAQSPGTDLQPPSDNPQPSVQSNGPSSGPVAAEPALPPGDTSAPAGQTEQPSAQAVSPDTIDRDTVRPAAIPAGWNMYFKRLAGTAFHPRFSTSTFSATSSGGCITQGAGSEVLVADLQLPDGVIVDILRLYYYDTSANNSQLFFTSYEDDGTFQNPPNTDIASILSAGNTGYGTTANSAFQYTVDNYTYSLLLNWRQNTIDSTMQLCGVRLRFWGPAILNGFLPTIQK